MSSSGYGNYVRYLWEYRPSYDEYQIRRRVI